MRRSWTAGILSCALAALGVLAGHGAGASHSQAAAPVIVGGSDAEQDYPFMASFQRGGEHSCGGSLVGPDWVLTAAHCVDGVEPEDLDLRIGSKRWREGGEEATIAEVVVHPDFDWESAGSDIALVRLGELAESAPIELGTAAEAGTRSRLLGWGQTCPDPGCGEPAETLQQLDAEIIDPAECESIDSASELCTSYPGGDSGVCYGDSGGPQIVRTEDGWNLIGVTSRPGYEGPSCAKGPSIYTNAVAYTDWITDHTGPDR
ncbi:MAG: S1 family peptidase [Haloechinothrix sp.]